MKAFNLKVLIFFFVLVNCFVFTTKAQRLKVVVYKGSDRFMNNDNGYKYHYIEFQSKVKNKYGIKGIDMSEIRVTDSDGILYLDSSDNESSDKAIYKVYFQYINGNTQIEANSLTCKAMDVTQYENRFVVKEWSLDVPASSTFLDGSVDLPRGTYELYFFTENNENIAVSYKFTITDINYVKGEHSLEQMRTEALPTELDYQGALEYFTSSLNNFPDNKNALFHIAKINYNINKYKEALENLNQFILLDTTNVDAYIYRGKIHTINGEIDNALSDFNRIYEIGGQHKYNQSQFYIGLANFEKNDYESAKINFLSIEGEGAYKQMGKVALAMIYLKLNQLDNETINECSKALTFSRMDENDSGDFFTKKQIDTYKQLLKKIHGH